MAGQLTIDTLKASSGVFATQNAIGGITNAWVNFNSSSGSSAVIRSSFNVSSVTYNSSQLCTVNFTTALADANYAAIVNSGISGASATSGYSGVNTPSNNSYGTKTSSACQVYACNNPSASNFNPYEVSVAFFR